MNLPDDVAATLAEVCGRYGDKPIDDDHVFGEVLNEVAWRHRHDGWGLSRKTGGKRVPSPVGEIAEDVLHHRPSNLHWDVLEAARLGNPLKPARAGSTPIGPMLDPNRPWVAPVEPRGHQPPSPPPRPDDPPAPPVTPPPAPDHAVLDAIRGLTAAVDALPDRIAAKLAEDIGAIKGTVDETYRGIFAESENPNTPSVLQRLAATQEGVGRIAPGATVCRFPSRIGGLFGAAAPADQARAAEVADEVHEHASRDVLGDQK